VKIVSKLTTVRKEKSFMKFILGQKQEMTQIFNEEGRVFPATVLKIEPLTVTDIRTEERDGYNAVQVGTGERKEKNINKAQREIGNYRSIKEFRTEGPSDLKVGDKIEIDSFEVGDTVIVSGTSKGKGFQGVVKRHGFHGGPRSHGQKHSEREGGSIGATGPQRVFKGKKMPGRMGGDRTTIKNLKVLEIDKDNGLMYISGAIPGRRGSLVEVRG